MQENQPSTHHNSAEDQPVALLLCDDLMFGVRLQTIAKASGFKPLTLRPGAALSGAIVLVVDLGFRGDWAAVVRRAALDGIYVVAFGPHMDSEARRQAKAAGANRVLANSNLQRDLPGILAGIHHTDTSIVEAAIPPGADPA